MFPGPGLLDLVVREGSEGPHQEPLIAIRAQAHIDLVKLTGGGLGGHHMNGALAQARIELVVGQGLGTGGHGIDAIAAVEKDQIQVRAIAQLDPPQLAITDHQKAGLPGPNPGGGPMPLNQVAIGQGDNALQAGLGDVGEIVADHHEGDSPRQIGGGDPQPVALGELAQPLHLLFQVLRVQGVQEGIQLGLQLGPAQG